MGLRMKTLQRVPRGARFDVVIVGGGPAGFAAGVYASRFLLKTLLVTEEVGGQLNLTNLVEDYPGTGSIEASRLVKSFREHAESFGVRVVEGVRVDSIAREGDLFRVEGSKGFYVASPAVIIATGSRRRKLGVPGEEELSGRGVSYCSICDAPLFKGRDSVVVVGGGDSALEGVLMLSGYVKRVYLVHRRTGFRAKPFYVEQARGRDNVVFVLNSVVKEIIGAESVEAVIVERLDSGERLKLEADGVFIEIGFEPPTEWFRSLGLETDSTGYIVVDDWMRTNIEGVFAAGDCTNKWIGFRQVVTAAAMGSIAAYSAYNYLTEKGLFKPSLHT